MLKITLSWIAAILIAVLSGSAALSSIAKIKSPTFALSLIPQNGFAAQEIAAGLTTASFSENKGSFPELVNSSWSEMAFRAFRLEPVTPDALAVIALSNTGDTRRELMQKAFMLSRRQNFATGWLIADSGKRSKIVELLDYYDILLRTSSSASNVVMPVFLTALADDQSISAFYRLLSRNPPWAGRFWQQVVQSPNALRNATEIRNLLGTDQDRGGVYQDTALIYALIKENQFQVAEKLFVSLTSSGQSRASLVRNSSFQSASKYPPFDWQLFSSGDYGASIDRGSMNLSVIANSGGLLARQLVSLPNEVLTLSVEASTEIPTESNVFIELLCASNSRANTISAKIKLSEKFIKRNIDNRQGSCTYYWINVYVRSLHETEGFDLAVASLNLTIDQTRQLQVQKDLPSKPTFITRQ